MTILQPPSLARLLRWDIAETPQILRNKDGRLMACVRIAGHDLHSALGAALVAQAQQINSILRRLEGAWMLQSESRRQAICTYPEPTFTNPPAALIDEERQQDFMTPDRHWETVSTLVLTWRGRGQGSDSLTRLFYKNLPPAPARKDVQQFYDESRRILDLLSECLESLTWLEGKKALGYLHSTISMKEYDIDMPDIPVYLDHYLTDMDLERVHVPGSLLRWPKLGEHYLRCVGVKRYPKVSHPGMFEILDELSLPSRACIRWLPMGQQTATSELRKFAGAHWSHKDEGTRINKAAVSLSEQAATFQQAIEEHEVSAGHPTQTVVVWGKTFQEATDRATEIERTLNSIGCVAKLETLNTLSAFLGTLPGEHKRNVRKPLLHSRNLADMGPWHQQSRGTRFNRHLGNVPLMQVTARGSTPYGFDTYDDDVGHFMILGPTGMGKSFLLALMATQWLRYQGNVRFFDKDLSAMITTWAMGGQWFDVGKEVEKGAKHTTSMNDPDFQGWGTLWTPPRGQWLCFETNDLFKTPEIVPKVLGPLINSIKDDLDGTPTMISLDEGWRYLQDSFFEGKIQDFCLTLRKANAIIGLSTQNPEHITKSRIGSDLYQQCVTKIFLANPAAIAPKIAEHYEELGMNERQRAIIAHLTRKKQYYVVGPDGSAVIELHAGPVQLAICGSSTKRDLADAEAIYAKDPTNFTYNWLMHKNVPDAAVRLGELICALSVA